jgi:hypothetical protein
MVAINDRHRRLPSTIAIDDRHQRSPSTIVLASAAGGNRVRAQRVRAKSAEALQMVEKR